MLTVQNIIQVFCMLLIYNYYDWLKILVEASFQYNTEQISKTHLMQSFCSFIWVYGRCKQTYDQNIFFKNTLRLFLLQKTFVVNGAADLYCHVINFKTW